LFFFWWCVLFFFGFVFSPFPVPRPPGLLRRARLAARPSSRPSGKPASWCVGPPRRGASPTAPLRRIGQGPGLRRAGVAPANMARLRRYRAPRNAHDNGAEPGSRTTEASPYRNPSACVSDPLRHYRSRALPSFSSMPPKRTWGRRRGGLLRATGRARGPARQFPFGENLALHSRLRLRCPYQAARPYARATQVTTTPPESAPPGSVRPLPSAPTSTRSCFRSCLFQQ